MKSIAHNPSLPFILTELAFVVMLLLGVQHAPWAAAIAAEQERVSYSKEGMERVYQRGIEAFKNKDYQPALYWFSIFLDAFPEAELADNALYWKGEALYALKDYQGAAEAFGQVVARYPRGQKAPVAMLKLGLSYNEMGNQAEAVKYFRKLVSTYPGTEAARLAQQRIKDVPSGK